MEIYKKRVRILAILIVLFVLIGCEDQIQNKKEINPLKETNNDLIELLEMNNKVMQEKFNEFAIIQEELNKINTNRVIKINYNGNEIPVVTVYQKEKMLSKINDIKTEMAIREKRIKYLQDKLNKTGQDSSGLNRLIKSLKKSINEKELVIEQLLVENNEISLRNNNLNIVIEENEKQIVDLKEEMVLKDLRLNAKYLFLVSRKNSKVSEIKENRFLVNYSLRNIELLSAHPKGSYSLIKRRNGITIFSIIDEKYFWSNSNNIIIKIKQKSL